MKTLTTIFFLLCIFQFSFDAGAQTTWYARGDFNGWGTTDQLYDDGTNGDPVAGDSIFSKLITIAAAGRYEWKVATSDWSISFPSSNSWIRTGSNNAQLLFTFDTNFYPDIWLPNTNIINCSDQIPPSNDVVAVGDHNGWNNSGSQLMHDDGLDGDWLAGDGIFAYHIIVASPGSYNWKPTWYGTWDAWGSDNRSVNSANVSYTTSSNNENVYFYLDSNTGRVATASNPLPVELISFTAKLNDNTVYLNWQTATELNNQGFEIERAVFSHESPHLKWTNIGFISGFGTTTEPRFYSFSDNISGVNASALYYRLKQIDYDGGFKYSGIIEVSVLPSEFLLGQNYPNPFNPSTKITFSLPEKSKVSLKVFDMLGKEAAVLVEGYVDAGFHEIEFDATGLPSGIYIYTLNSDNYQQIRKMMLIK